MNLGSTITYPYDHIMAFCALVYAWKFMEESAHDSQ